MRKYLLGGLLELVIGGLLGYGFVWWAGEILSIGLTMLCLALAVIWSALGLLCVLIGECRWWTAVRVWLLICACAVGSGYWWLPNVLF